MRPEKVKNARFFQRRVTEEIAKAIIEKIRQAKRPVINAGNGIRLAGAHETFLKWQKKLGIPGCYRLGQ